ncbi:exodeoxyribonuclease VII small subunit [Mucilaginibacter terrae]|uniref:exodeoxyribonuclease VII small subunit n=1 Tax=Mucilaginibacter terrae TaxID=1955052 RepID=UPI0036299AC5
MTEVILTYDEAYRELDEIHDSLVNGEVPVDVLAEKLKRTAFLVKYCKEKLQSADKDVNAIISEMEQEEKVSKGAL